MDFLLKKILYEHWLASSIKLDITSDFCHAQFTWLRYASLEWIFFNFDWAVANGKSLCGSNKC